MGGKSFEWWMWCAAALAVVLAAAAASNFQNTRRLREDSRRVSHTHEVLETIESVAARLREAESAHRSYLIVGGNELPSEFGLSLESASGETDHLRTLTEDNETQQARIAALKRLVGELASLWARTAVARREEGFEAARAMVAKGRTRELMVELTALLRSMGDEERDLLAQRTDRSRHTYLTALITGLISGLAALTGLGALTGLLRRHLADRAEAAALVAEQGERMRTTLASIGDAVITTDESGLVTGMNAVAESLTGWSQSEAAGEPLEAVFRIVNEDSRREVESPATRALREGVVVGLANHTLLISKDGTERPIDDSAAPIRCKDGTVIGCVLVFRDVTERRESELRLRRKSDRLRLLADAAAVMLKADDCDTMLRGLFDQIAPHLGLDAYFNYSFEEAGNFLKLESFVGVTDEEAYAFLRLELGQGLCGTAALHRQAVVVSRIQGAEGPVAQRAKELGFRTCVCHPLLDGDRLLGTLSFASRSREEFDPLELDFLRTLCYDATAATVRLRLVRRLKEDDRRKDAFLATLAHELRNPLAPIRNAMQIMKLSGEGQAREAALALMDRQIEHMVRLIDDLLDANRITSNKLQLRRRRLTLSAVVESAAETSRPHIDQMGHELVVALPPHPVYLDADPVRLAQVFSNLLNNAAKYTDRGGRIRLSADLDGGRVVVSVEDDGIGIPAKVLPRVFDMFAQVSPASDRSQGGLGIGLSLAKGLVEMHGGTLEARSEGTGFGSVFTVRLPVAEGNAQDGTAPRPARAPREGRRRVVIADDNRDAADSLTRLLSLLGHEARTAYDGRLAVGLAEEFRPEVMVLDIGMPELDGHEAARRIREQPWGKGIVLIALTGWGQEEDRRLSREAGFDHHLVKPVAPETLEGLLSELRRAGSDPS